MKSEIIEDLTTDNIYNDHDFWVNNITANKFLKI